MTSFDRPRHRTWQFWVRGAIETITMAAVTVLAASIIVDWLRPCQLAAGLVLAAYILASDHLPDSP